MDRRTTPTNGRVAATGLLGQVEAEEFVDGRLARIAVPLVDLCPEPGAMRDRQLLLGTPVTVFEERGGFAFVQAPDGYVGYLPCPTISDDLPMATHRVAVRATHAYVACNIKEPEVFALSFGAEVAVVDERDRFFEIAQGLFVPKTHLRPLDQPFSDPVTIAQLFFGTPYLWGGNSSAGIDCSGLIQAALRACDIECPADSDQQCAALGETVSPGSGFTRGDLLFWPGHVGIMVDADTLLHANAFHMAVTYEPVAKALLRIDAAGDGPLTRQARPMA